MKNFRQALIQSDNEVHPKDRTRQIGKQLYAHYWDDGLILRKDVYWYDGKSIVLEDMLFKYEVYETWKQR